MVQENICPQSQNNKNAIEKLIQSPVFFGEVCLGWNAHEGQHNWLEGARGKQNFCRAGNRWGKTESIAVKHLWKCAFKIRHHKWSWDLPYVSINTAHSLDQARISLDKAWRLVNRKEATNFKDAFIQRYIASPFPKIEFTNGSIWWARSTAKQGRYLHGHDYDYVSNDEGAVDPDLGFIIDEVLTMRLLDRGGQLDCISTGKRGSEFNRRFDEAKADASKFAHQGSTLQNPHIDQDAVREAMHTLDAGLIEERIHGGERPSDGRIPFSSIEKALRQSTGLQPRSPGHRYTSGWDLAKTRDFTAGVTLDILEKPYQMVAFERFNEKTVGLEGKTFWDYVYSRIRLRHQQYGGITTIDTTGLGIVVGDQLADIGAEPLTFSATKRDELIATLELAFGLSAIGITNEEMDDGARTWRLIDEIEVVEDTLRGLDGATALALALYPVKESLQLPQIQARAPIKIAGRKA